MSRAHPTLLAAALLVAFASPALAADPKGFVLAVEPSVTAQEPFFPAPRELDDGASIYVYSALKSSREGKAKVQLDDGTLVVIGPQTDIKLESFDLDAASGIRLASIEMERGRVRLRAEDRFGASSFVEIITATARIRFNGGSGDGHVGVETGLVKGVPLTRVTVFEGEAEVEAYGVEAPAERVPAGHRTVIAEGEAPAPAAITPDGFSERFIGLVDLTIVAPFQEDFYRRALPGRDFSARANPGAGFEGEPEVSKGPQLRKGTAATARDNGERRRRRPPGVQPVDQEAFRTGSSVVEVEIR